MLGKTVLLMLAALLLLFVVPGCEKDDFEGKTKGPFTDPRDGQKYTWVRIGEQIWMAENLRVTKYKNGDAIPTGLSDTDWKELEMYLGMSQAEADEYGWRGTNEGRKLKSERTAPDSQNVGIPTNDHPRWDYHADNFGLDEAGFSALPGGVRYSHGSFSYLGSRGVWWSATEDSSTNAWYRSLLNRNAGEGRSTVNKVYGYSVRCVRD